MREVNMQFIAKPKMNNKIDVKVFGCPKEAVKYLNEYNQLEEQDMPKLTAEDWVMIGKLEVPAGVYFKNNKMMGAA